MPGAFNPQAFNRYAYALNNPVRYTDPTGHMVDEGTGGGGSDEPAEEEETEEETACAENDTDCDGVADDEETDDTPADTGDDQGPDDKPGKCDVASADIGFGSDCGGYEEQQEEAQCGPHAINCSVAQYLYNASKIMDIGSLGLGIFNEGVILGATGLGFVFGGGPVGAGEACLGTQVFVNGTFRMVNRTLTGGSLGATVLGDVFAGETRFDSEGRTASVGASTLNSIFPTAVNMLSPINEGGLAASTWQVAVNDFPIVSVPHIPILHYVEPAVFTW